MSPVALRSKVPGSVRSEVREFNDRDIVWVEVDASDESANPDDSVTRDVRVSEPVLVDNTPPTLSARVEGDRVRGEVEDGASVVLRVEVSVDGVEWRALRAEDGVLDERREAFAGAIPAAGVRAGEHVLSRVGQQVRRLSRRAARRRLRCSPRDKSVECRTTFPASTDAPCVSR